MFRFGVRSLVSHREISPWLRPIRVGQIPRRSTLFLACLS
jgi:hypothetical protein